MTRDQSTRESPPPVAGFYRASAFCADDSVGYLVKRVMVAITTSADSRLEGDGLTHIQWGPLFMLRSGRASTVAELARELNTDPGAMTRLLDRLEAKGLCRRQRCTDDRRVVRIELTAEGLAASAKVPPVLSDVMNEMLSGFSREEWESLKSMLRRMIQNAEVHRAHEAELEAQRAAKPPRVRAAPATASERRVAR